MPTPHELDLDFSWSITEAGFSDLLLHMRRAGHLARIVEFGSGRSTIRLALAFPDSTVISIENDRGRLEEVKELQRQHCPSADIRLFYCPLVPHSYGTTVVHSYQVDSIVASEPIDCVIIDGPPFYTLRGRQVCLHQTYTELRDGGLVFLDDCFRRSEQTIISNWLAIYAGGLSLIEILKTGHGIAMLQKSGTVAPNWDASEFLADSIKVAEARRRIREAMLHIDDAAWLRLRQSGAMREEMSVNDLVKVVEILRACYDVSPEDVSFTVQKDAALARKELNRLHFEVLHTLKTYLDLQN